MVTRSITLAEFDARFDCDADPWKTFSDRDEAAKRRAILRAMGPGPWGRVLELGAGNGSNSAAIARRALRLDATEGTCAGTRLVASAIAGHDPRSRAIRLALPGRFPRVRYDLIVIAELLYYLDDRTFAATARDAAFALRPGGRLVLAHHRIDFHDFAQHAAHIHRRFLADTGERWSVRRIAGNRRWTVVAARRDAR